MSFPNSRTNIQITNPYSLYNPADLRYSSRKMDFSKISPHCGCLMPTQIPYHNAYTTQPASSYAPRRPFSEFNPVVCGQTMPCSEKFMNTRLGNQTAREILTRNKAMSNQLGTYPFYDDPSVMWSTQNQYYNLFG